MLRVLLEIPRITMLRLTFACVVSGKVTFGTVRITSFTSVSPRV